MDVAEWLRGLGLEQYAPAFRNNDIDGEVLRRLAADDLRDLGVTSVGHRRLLLDAIAALRDAQRIAEASLAPVAAARVIGAAERRQLTVMFIDLAHSSVLAQHLDPEELGDVIGAYHRCVAEAVGRFDGFLAKYLGDGVLTYFGYPVAHEDDAERAIRAGLEITRRVAALHGGGAPLSARVGIATGLVVVGEIGGGEANAVVGETPNLAARLQAEAPPCGVVIAPATRRLAGDWFRYRDLGARPLKGIAKPMPLTQVLDEHPAESRFAATRAALLTPFVGREQEISLLLDRWRLASEGEGQVVVLSGEAGIGKSRICEVLRERLAEAGTRIPYQCSPYYTETALYPVAAQLRAAARLQPDDPPAVKLDKLEHLVVPSKIEVDATVPLLADLLAIPTTISGADDGAGITKGADLARLGGSDLRTCATSPCAGPPWSGRRAGLAPAGKAPPCHSPTSYLILRNINILRHNIQILANIAGRRASRRRHRGCKRRRGRSGAPIKKARPLDRAPLHTMVPLAQRYDVPINRTEPEL